MEDDTQFATIVTSSRYIQRRQTVPANLSVDLDTEHHKFAAAFKKFVKEVFSRKEQVRKDEKKLLTSDGVDSPRSLTRRMKKLRKSSVTEEDILHFAVSREDLKAARHILEQGTVDVNSMRPPGVSALHQACAIGNLDAIKMLLDHGADMELRTWQGQSAVQITARYGHFEAAEILLENGANMEDIRDGF